MTDWIAVHPDQNDENIVDPFWFGQVVSMDATHLEVQWYVPNLQHKFKSNWKKHETTPKFIKARHLQYASYFLYSTPWSSNSISF